MPSVGLGENEAEHGVGEGGEEEVERDYLSPPKGKRLSIAIAHHPGHIGTHSLNRHHHEHVRIVQELCGTDYATLSFSITTMDEFTSMSTLTL